MSLGGSINNFCGKYKRPLTILVLVFFMYKLFDLYGNVYEGNTSMPPGSMGGAGLSPARQIAKLLKRKADGLEYHLKQNPNSFQLKHAYDQARKEADDAKIKADNEDLGIKSTV